MFRRQEREPQLPLGRCHSDVSFMDSPDFRGVSFS